MPTNHLEQIISDVLSPRVCALSIVSSQCLTVDTIRGTKNTVVKM
jgi:hypothetical protein